MLPGYPGHTVTRAEQTGGIIQSAHSVLAVYFSKGTSSEMDGVSTYLALTFGTLLSSQGTDASFETVSPVSPGASLRPFGLSCFQPYQIRFPFRFRSEFRFRPPVG